MKLKNKILLTSVLMCISAYSYADMKECLLYAAQDNDEKTIEYCTPYLKDKNNPEATAILASVEDDKKKTLDYALWVVNFYNKNGIPKNSHGFKGYTSGLVLIGNIYYFGQAGKVDKTKGLEYITKAANLGNDYAQYQLGEVFQSGENGTVTRNIATAYKWTEIALANGSEEAQGSYLNVNLDGFTEQVPYCLAMGEQLVAQAYIDGSAGLSKDTTKAKKYLNDAIALYKDNEPTKDNLKYCPEGADKLNLDSAKKQLESL